ncbi:hypothetical protein [Tenacibaculum sp. SDUM215027]|uniref:hypothetical protein n=1 Tax=Tenacibaculum sp. SDUM215027 TaxID=3422596 RepID=UPI003D322C05
MKNINSEKDQFNLAIWVAVLMLSFFYSCTSPKISTGKYASYYKNSERDYFYNGPVKVTRSSIKIYKIKDSTFREKYSLYATPYSKLKVIALFGYHKFDKNGIKQVFFAFDSLTQPFPTGEVKDKRTLARMSKFIQDPVDIKFKLQFKQNLLIKKFVFNPYRVHYINRHYDFYDVIIKKDSSYKRSANAYNYVLNKNGTIHQEKQISIWDNDLDGVIDEKSSGYTATYHYNEKNQLVKKTFNFEDYPYFPDHSLVNWYRGAEPHEEYTYDDAGNLTSVRTTDFRRNGKERFTRFLEKYSYNKNNQLIHKKRWAAGGYSFNKDWKAYNEFFYTNKQEVAKVVAYENDEETVYATYRMEYFGHDEYDNWTKCYFYLNDEEKPYAEVNRIIEYY